MSENIRIGLVGTGFGRRVMLPAFAATDGAEVVAVCSARQENAETAAREHHIPGVYTDYEAMLDGEALDLVVITTPPHLHWPMVREAAQRQIHILCEKPTALDLEEAEHMLEAAQVAGVVHLIDHELRFNPTLRELKARIDGGFLGDPRSVSFQIQWNYPLDRTRPWGWWFDEAKGGGLLGALGSHQIDLLRWLLDTEFKRIHGHLHTFVGERPLPGGDELRPVTTDDYCAFLAELDNCAFGTVVLNATARTPNDRERWTLGFHGEDGSLLYDGEGRLWALRQEGQPEELTVPDPAAEVPGLPEGVFARSFVHFSRAIVSALRRGESSVPGAATFLDGLRVQAVIDAVRVSHRNHEWVEVFVA